jgi:hypothetical protein
MLASEVLNTCGCGTPPFECVEDDQYLSRLNEPDGSFRFCPNPTSGEPDYSMVIGNLPVEEALAARLKRSLHQKDLENREVRVTTAGELRRRGFGVVHTPSKRNKRHVSVVHPSSPDQDLTIPWTSDQASQLESCFENLASSVERGE